MNETSTRQREKNQQSQKLVLEKINKTDKPLIILIKEKQKTEFLDIRNRIIHFVLINVTISMK